MKGRNPITLLAIVALTTLISGCKNETMPEVNEVNCLQENVQRIKDKDIKEEFTGLCLRRVDPRSGGYEPSPKRVW